jgi:hypothetical protein
VPEPPQPASSSAAASGAMTARAVTKLADVQRGVIEHERGLIERVL